MAPAAASEASARFLAAFDAWETAGTGNHDSQDSKGEGRGRESNSNARQRQRLLLAGADEQKRLLLDVLRACSEDSEDDARDKGDTDAKSLIVSFLENLDRRLHDAPPRDHMKWMWLVSELGVCAALGVAPMNKPYVRSTLQWLSANVGALQTTQTKERLRDKTPQAKKQDGSTPRQGSLPTCKADAQRTLASSMGPVEARRKPRDNEDLRRAHTVALDDIKLLPLLQRTSSSTISSLPLLARSMSSFLHVAVEETVFCYICFENVAATQAFTLSICGHRFCASCLTTYLELKIRDGHVYPTCFHDMEDPRATGSRIACAVSVLDVDIKRLVSPDTWLKYERFKFNKECDYARQCPYCSYSQECLGPKDPVCVCEGCGRNFCFEHGGAHEKSSCSEYERTQMVSEKINRAAIARIAKPCPGCLFNVEKNGGCNHMTCIMCNTSFCWICGKQIDDVATHYALWNTSGCGGQQMTDVENQTRVEETGWALVQMVYIVVFMPIGFVITIVLTLLSGCCLPCVFWLHEDPKAMFMGSVEKVATLLLLVVGGLLAFVPYVLSLVWPSIVVCFCPSRRQNIREVENGDAVYVSQEFA